MRIECNFSGLSEDETTYYISQMPQDTSLTGAAGEHLVLSRLLARGILAAQAPRGTRKADILVNHLDGRAPCVIQVKTRLKGADGGWHMKEKHEDIIDEDMFYCFVDFQPENPTVYVVPAEKVARIVKSAHATWLDTPGKYGQVHKNSVMRRIRPNYGFEVPEAPDGWLEGYRESWNLLFMRRDFIAD